MKSNHLVTLYTTIIIAAMSVILLATIYESISASYQRQLEQEQAGIMRIATNLIKERGGDFSVRKGKLLAGKVVLNHNNDLVDSLAGLFHGVVSIYQDHIRIATSLRQASGERATQGVLLPEVERSLFIEDRPYTGKEILTGNEYLSSYHFLKSSQGEILGVLQISVPTKPYEEALAKVMFRGIVAAFVAMILVGFIVFFALRKLSRELALVSGRAKALLNSTREGVFGMDRKGKGTFLNAAGSRYLGYLKEDILNQDMVHLIRKPKEKVEGAAPVSFIELASSDDLIANEDEFQTKKGEVLPVKYFVSPVRERGKITGYVLSFTNMAEAKEAEKRLVETTNRLEAIIQSAESEHQTKPSTEKA